MDNSKIDSWLRLYLDTINERGLEFHVNNCEGYKFKSVNTFQKHFDLNATDLAGNLAQSIHPNNLVIGAMYFPRRMLLIYAFQYTEETRVILRNLFDETKNIVNRINETRDAFVELEKRRAKIEGNQPHNTFIGLRFISLLLGFYAPEKYNALKPNEWKVFARYLNPKFKMPKGTSAGEQYVTYSKYIEEMRQLITNRSDINEIRSALTNGLEFEDTTYRWTTQDIIYTTARAYADKKAAEATPEAKPETQVIEMLSIGDESVEEQDTGFMALESHLEEYVIRNWHNIDFGEKLDFYVEDDGTTGQQYTTDVGTIDILATDKNGDFVVIELKKDEYGFAVVGQILNYIQWVKEHLAEDKKVRGIIIVGKAKKQLLMAVKPVSDIVELKEYSVTLQLKSLN